MSKETEPGTYGELIEPTTLRIQRLLPGPIERIWAFLTDGELRRKWLAAGPMEMRVGAPFEFVWRNEELNDPPGRRPQGFDEENRMMSCITQLDPPRRISFTWNNSGDVTFEEFSAAMAKRFPSADANSDGKMTVAEIADAIERMRAERMAQRIVKRFDTNGDGELTKDEIESRQKKMFALLDRNDDGKIEKSEMPRRPMQGRK